LILKRVKCAFMLPSTETEQACLEPSGHQFSDAPVVLFMLRLNRGFEVKQFLITKIIIIIFLFLLS
jgi:hypothetical protein